LSSASISSHFSPKVSIITITYNSGQTLEKTIQSVINQNYSNIEYIIIDGGSTDETLNIIKKYQQQISFWVSEPDEGISDAFNKGLSKVTGDIIGIINSDDYYSEGALTEVVKAFQANPDYGFVFGDQVFIDWQGNKLFTQKGDSDYHKTIRYGMPSIPHPTVFIKNGVYQKYGLFDKAYKTAMDYELLLRICNHDVKGYYIPTILAYMRLNGESDKNYIRGYRESREISIQYGYNAIMAWTRYYYKCIKTYTRKKLEQIGLELLVKSFRTYLAHRYRY
jgi:glycosyltransferase involved in cell wall biosynthesis